jgi:hypothetical protein
MMPAPLPAGDLGTWIMISILLRLSVAVMMLAGTAHAQSGPTSAERQDMVTRTAQVRALDMQNRRVLLLADDGRNVEIVAGPEVRNLPQLAVGDTVRVSYFESVAVRMADAGSPNRPVGGTVVERAPEGAKPGVMVAEVVHAVVEFVSYDPRTFIATYIKAGGTPASVTVRPEVREFAAARKSGDKIDVTVTEAVAISIEETTK